MHYIIWLLLPLLAACAQYHTLPSVHDQIVQKCTEAGYNDKELDDCISSAKDAYNKEVAKQQKEWAKEVERRNKEMIKAQKEARRRQLEADGAKCKDYGFNKGTKDFATCMMQIEMVRKQEEQQQQALAAQQQIANQQMEANRRLAQSQMLQNYFLQQQAIAAQNQRNNINCTSYRAGNYTNTNCY